MKVGIVTDSNSGITQEEAKALGISVIAMPFTINGEEYFEEINLSADKFFELQESNAEIFTSQPIVGNVKKVWDKMLKEYDQLVHIPMSSGLSGSCQTATMLSEEYYGKVQVVDNQKVSVTMKQDVLDALQMASEGKDAKEIKETLEAHKFESMIYIAVPSLKYLEKGGRITPATALLGGMLKIKPVLRISGEKLDASDKVRTMAKAQKIMMDHIEEDMKTLVPNGSHDDFHLYVAYSKDNTLGEAFKEMLEERFSDMKVEMVDALALSICCHTGPDAIAVAISKKL